MTEESINTIIAEACGFSIELSNLQSGLDIVKDGERRPLPSYCSDLNAMHEAEKVLIKKHYDSYEHRLGMTVNRPWHATARQRAEAFLRTIGKWEDEQ